MATLLLAHHVALRAPVAQGILPPFHEGERRGLEISDNELTILNGRQADRTVAQLAYALTWEQSCGAEPRCLEPSEPYKVAVLYFYTGIRYLTSSFNGVFLLFHGAEAATT